jgi:hypothetical protein
LSSTASSIPWTDSEMAPMSTAFDGWDTLWRKTRGNPSNTYQTTLFEGIGDQKESLSPLGRSNSSTPVGYLCNLQTSPRPLERSLSFSLLCSVPTYLLVNLLR